MPSKGAEEQSVHRLLVFNGNPRAAQRAHTQLKPIDENVCVNSNLNFEPEVAWKSSLRVINSCLTEVKVVQVDAKLLQTRVLVRAAASPPPVCSLTSLWIEVLVASGSVHSERMLSAHLITGMPQWMLPGDQQPVSALYTLHELGGIRHC